MPTIEIAGKEFRVKDKSELKTRHWVELNRKQKTVSALDGLDQVEALVELLQVLVPEVTLEDLDIDLDEIGPLFANAMSACTGKELLPEEEDAPEGTGAPKGQ